MNFFSATSLPSGLADQEELEQVLVNRGAATGPLSAAGVPEPTGLALGLAFKSC